MNHKESEVRVFQTSDYARFKILKGNRPHKKSHLKLLKESISNHGDLGAPILVNDEYEIIDGQHRIKIFEELELPVRYIIKGGFGLKEVHILNSNRKNWTMTEFMNCYVEIGKKEYIKYKEFYGRHGFPQSTTLIVVLGASAGGQQMEEFKRGNFIFKSPAEAEDRAEKILMFKDLYAGYKRQLFVATMIRLFRHEEYQHAEFISKLKYQREKLFDANSVNSYLRLIEEIYNYRRQKKANFYWDLRINGK